MASRNELLQEVRRNREAREQQRKSEGDAAARKRQEEEEAAFAERAVLFIQRVGRGFLVRRRWKEADWKGLQKQVHDLENLVEVVLKKGQVFVPPITVVLQLVRRALRHASHPVQPDLAKLLGALAQFVVAGLRVPLADAQRSLCGAMGAAPSATAAHAPDPRCTVLRFSKALLAVCGACKEGPGLQHLSDLMDTRSWGQGRAMEESPVCRAVAPRFLSIATDPAWRSEGRKSQTGLQVWKAAAASTVSLWPVVGAAPPRLESLAGIAASWLAVASAEGGLCGSQAQGGRSLASGVAGGVSAPDLLEAIVGVPRMGALLAKAQAARGLATDWSALLRSYSQALEAARRLSGGETGLHGGTKALDREYMLVYVSGNLWELHEAISLPLEPLLVVQGLLTEHLEVSMLPSAPVSSSDEPASIRALRRQLQHLADAVPVKRLFGEVLAFHPREMSVLEQERSLRPYQRHCIAVALQEVSPRAVEALCRIYSVLLLKARALMRAKSGWGPQVFHGLASTIAYMEGGDVTRALWRFVQGFYDWRPSWRQQPLGCFHMLHLHGTLLSQLLSVMSQDELKGDESPLHDHDLSEYITRTTAIVAHLIWHMQHVGPPSASQPGAGGGTAVASPAAASMLVPKGPLLEALLEQLGRVLSQLQTYTDRATQEVPAQVWHAPADILKRFQQAVNEAAREAGQGAAHRLGPCAEKMLRYVPHSVPFEQRVALLRMCMQQVRERSQARPFVRLMVRRTHLFEDGLAVLADADWHARFQVMFVNATGQREQGQDAGGLFKEFLEKMAETAFNPEYGLFRTTESRLLFPNPEASQYHDNASRLFEFLGLVIGKAIFEGIVVEPCFAPFFLAKLLGRHNSYYDLQSLDPALFANLQRLKSYDGNVADLCCSFVATAADGKEVPLLPDGQNITVTNDNRFKYLYLLSDYKLNVELKAASEAFLAGFQRLVDERWVRMFGENELQQVISGGRGRDVDVEDLRRNTQYSGCSGPKDKVVADFFTAMKAMTPDKRSLLLRFVTSCSRTPLLGFSHLVPPFTVHKVPIRSDSDKLPTASTCFNMLKLPTYSSWKVMKQKLEFVVVQGAGFELD